MKDRLLASSRPAGRPRGFNVEDVLKRAIPVFCENGYDGASIGLLTEATGLKAGSLYKAFKDKRGLFTAAFAHYSRLRRGQLLERVTKPRTGLERVAETLRFHLELASGPEGRQGCLISAVLAEATTLDDTLSSLLDISLTQDRDSLIVMLYEGLDDGSIRDSLEIEPCADLLLVLLQGLHAVGKLRNPTEHRSFIETALKALQ